MTVTLPSPLGVMEYSPWGKANSATSVSSPAPGFTISRTATIWPGSISPANTACWMLLPARLPVQPGPVATVSSRW